MRSAYLSWLSDQTTQFSIVMTVPGASKLTDRDLDPYADDPFFKRHTDSTWNACIGEQGNDDNYLDGYIDAALQLSHIVIDHSLLAKRDTLVLPILYNARHAVELVLKFATSHLERAGVVPRVSGRPTHNIRVYWERLDSAAVGDEIIGKKLEVLKPFVDSLSRIDRDGQELRYPLNQFSDPSLSAYSLANLQVIRTSLIDLSSTIDILKNRVVSFAEERRTGLFTQRCSRRDLVTIANLMPRREFWRSASFDQQKALVKARFKLSNRQFSLALDAIQSARETKAILGIETDLLYLSDDEILWTADQWRRIHPKIRERGGPVKVSDQTLLNELEEEQKEMGSVSDAVQQKISGAKLSELEAMFYLGRDGVYPEHFDTFVERKEKEHAAARDPKSEILHLMTKPNFLHSVTIAATKLGRLSLATQLSLK
ncbi:hypothetical protein P0R31_39450 [Bradyrhizobium yuanmingense]|uniref:hypothetical protein n=1 Tax=Bradyrhizobium yuanmingense TaxID=108015 RepID=UPI0023B9E116|nr:hypothetical protein [Bradyrhizobium yuanmingense]MDF0523272.1 hypothetical protein [Bradyrhizobium yuanmingense]